MNLYVYSDESGVLDYKNQFYIFSGIVFINKENKDHCSRIFYAWEKFVKKNNHIIEEIKGTRLKIKTQKKILKRLMKFCLMFAIIINVKKIHKQILFDKKSKQRFLDWTYKYGLKQFIKNHHEINQEEIINIRIFFDEHNTATNVKYELKESIEQEFKIGIANFKTNEFINPICLKLKNVELKYCKSDKNCLIRISDILANYIYKLMKLNQVINDHWIHIIKWPLR